jgi:hypothetical protein
MGLHEYWLYQVFLLFSLYTLRTLFMRKLGRHRLFYFCHGWALAAMVSIPVSLFTFWYIPYSIGLFRQIASAILLSVGGLSCSGMMVSRTILGWEFSFSPFLEILVIMQTALVAWFYSRRIFHTILMEEPDTEPPLRFFLCHPSVKLLWILFFCNSLLGFVPIFMYEYFSF